METENNEKELVKRENSFVLQSTMSELHSNNEYCDVTIQVQNRSFQSHRFLLAASSEYFHAMFGGNFKERHIYRDEPIVLHDDVVDADAFELFLGFMYSGDVNIDDSNIFSVLTTIDFLKLRNPYIETKCTKFIRKRNRISKLIPSAIEIYKFSCMTKKADLFDVIRKHICQHLHRLSTDDVFESISHEDLIKLLQPKCPFWIYNQDIALNFLIGWVHQSHKERKQYFKELMKLIDLKKVSIHCISFMFNEFEKLFDRLENTGTEDDTGFQFFSPLCVIDNAKSEATIRLACDNFNIETIKKGPILWQSIPHIIQNLPWQLIVRVTGENTHNAKSIACFLKCSGHPTIKTWSCSATYNLSILRVSEEEEYPDFILKSDNNRLFNAEQKCWGFKSYTSLDKVIDDPQKGLIKDDIIIFQAHVIPGIPDLGV